MIKDPDIAYLNKILNELPDEVKPELETYLLKFLPSDAPLKEECCLKHLIRPSGRYCHNCPHHPLRGTNQALNIFVITKAISLLENDSFIAFISLLKEYNLPYPTAEEISELMLK